MALPFIAEHKQRLLEARPRLQTGFAHKLAPGQTYETPEGRVLASDETLFYLDGSGAIVRQEPNRIAILFEAWQTFKVIPTDGRDHPKNVDETWMGNSVGHWEGDTLVIDTIGFNDRTRLDTIGHPHTDQLHVIEKLTRTDPMHIGYEVTVIDPKAYKEPFTNKRIFTLKPNWELMEYSCEENNKDANEGHVK